jgi:CarD family transcriptional regulator
MKGGAGGAAAQRARASAKTPAKAVAKSISTAPKKLAADRSRRPAQAKAAATVSPTRRQEAPEQELAPSKQSKPAPKTTAKPATPRVVAEVGVIKGEQAEIKSVETASAVAPETVPEAKLDKRQAKPASAKVLPSGEAASPVPAEPPLPPQAESPEAAVSVVDLPVVDPEPAPEQPVAPDAPVPERGTVMAETDSVPQPLSAAAETQAEAPAPPRPAVPPMNRAAPLPRPLAKPEVFAEGDHVVYPTHGVGKVERIAVEEIAGHKLELIHITFEENRMTLRVPVTKARSAGLRKLATRKLFEEALNVLKGRARIKRTMWSRRAQEYEAKINSGDPLAIAEVVRDLHRNAGQPDQSFSERQIYEAAMDRLAAELAALDKTDKLTAATKLVEFLKTV